MTPKEQVHTGVKKLQTAMSQALLKWCCGEYTFVQHREDMTVASIEKADSAILSTAILTDCKELELLIRLTDRFLVDDDFEEPHPDHPRGQWGTRSA